MTRIKKLLFGAYCIFIVSSAAFSQNLLDYSNSLKYAEYLFDTHQYELAAVEFERVVFLEPGDTLAKLKLVRSYRYQNQYNTAIKRIEVFFPPSLEYLPAQFSEEYTKNMLHNRQFQKASIFLHDDRSLAIGQKTEYQLGILIMKHKWPEAKSFADEHVELISENEKYKILYGMASDGLNTRYKSPALAASLSAIIPGAGKVYTGNWKDAIYSFLFVSAGIWLTYNSYTTNGLGVNSVLWGSVTIAFYSANIFGSHKSARRFNQMINESYTREVEDILLNDFRYH